MLGVLVALVLQADDPVDFKRDIRPILSNSCFLCHGPDDKRRKGDLRLDIKEGAFRVVEGKQPFIPGKPDQSEAFRRMVTPDKDDHMPPAKSGKQLTPKQVELIRKWIQQGAKWSDHWAFVPPERPPVPPLAVPNPVDAFVRARLDREGLRPSPEAGRETLLRRLSLDLVGLPPTPEEIDSFLADRSPDAYEKQVDRLLASPHYGERWARHWLDAARYADSDGFEKDKPREAWFYRDWVINSFNRNLPYDQFVIEQIAGDLLPDPAQDQIVATGFLRNSMINEEGGVDPEQFRMEAMFDRMDAIGKSVLGLSINCCQCHNHKFDPITQDEYYKMFAFLNNDYEATTAVYTPEQLKQRSDILRQIAEIEGDLKHKNADWVQRMAAWEASVKNNQPEWIVLRPEIEDISTGGQRYLPQPDGSFLAQGYAPTKHTVKMIAHTDIEGITAFRLELLTDPNLPFDGPGRSYIKGTCALTEFSVEFAPETGKWKAEKIKFTKASADYGDPPTTPLEKYYDDKSNKPRVTGPVDYAIDGKEETAWGIDAGSVRR